MSNSKTKIRNARPYFLVAAVLIAIPNLLGYYRGHTGKLLIATHKIDNDLFFKHTVIYIFDHSFWGAKGIILNRPMNNVKPENFGVSEDYAIIYEGGPVGYPLVKAAALEHPKAASKWTTQPLYVFNYKILNKDSLPRVTNGKPLNVYVGVAGWHRGQLESEIKRGIWQVSECDITILEGHVAYENMWAHFDEKKQKNICE